MNNSIAIKPNGSGSVVNFTIPLRISISLGEPLPEVEHGSAALAESVAPSAIESVREPVEIKAYGKFSGDSLNNPTFDWNTAISCAACSNLAYEEPPDVKSICESQWQLSACQFAQNGATQCFVAATDKTIMVAFRGTKGALDWFSNLNVLERRTNFGSVHDGFYRAFQAVRAQLEALIEPLAQTRQVVLTGHSLGGALATMAAAHWNKRFKISSIYTFGQPRVGFKSFQQFASANFGDRLFRFVNADDVVPRVPPGYVHVGQLTHFDSQGGVMSSNLESSFSREPSSLSVAEFEVTKQELRVEQVQGLEGPQLEGLLPNYFSDHRLGGYLTKIMNKL